MSRQRWDGCRLYVYSSVPTRASRLPSKELDLLGLKMSALLGTQSNHDVAHWYIRVGRLAVLDEAEQRSDRVALQGQCSTVNGCIGEG